MKKLACLIIVIAAWMAPGAAPRARPAHASAPPRALTIDYPVDGTVFPPDISAPTFIWHDSATGVNGWRIDIALSDGILHTSVPGERIQIGKIDQRCIAPTNELPRLSAEQAEAHTWVPDAETWDRIKKRGAGQRVPVTISGLRAGEAAVLSSGTSSIEISADPAGAPIFYRDVPLAPSESERGVIKPLATSAVKLIAWRLRDISQPSSRLLMQGLPTCANCHSFSRDGRTLGMDLDGPQNDKGTYAVAAVQPHMSIATRNVFSWNSFPGQRPSRKTIGFMSQVSPDGQFVISTVNEEVYVRNFKDYRFLQVFYPTRGILAWYNRATGEMRSLPGADDTKYVQTDGVWSPDGKYVVFARALARDAYPSGRKAAAYANDLNEPPIQYDLYRVPFNGGRGGRAEPVAGASANGMSNSFPKVSPDGRWIVFVQARNGQLMRPDSLLFIVPAAGGTARRMRCNTALMNSWHSFSPNGRWLVFSSKSRSPYTQMFLTHIDQEGNDSPPVLVENATAANRAVNIPEFVNINSGGLLNIDVPAAEFYRIFDRAVEFGERGEYSAAIAEWDRALKMDAANPKAHSNLGVALLHAGRFDQAVAQFEEAIALQPSYADAHFNYGGALAQRGRTDEAIAQFRAAVRANPDFADAHNALGVLLVNTHAFDDAILHFEAALEAKPDFAQAHYNLARAFAEKGQLDRAIAHWQNAIEIKPDYAEAHNDLGIGLMETGRAAEASAHFLKALELKADYSEAEFNLGQVFAAQGRLDDAVAHWRKAVALDPEYAEARFSLGDALYARGAVREALDEWQRGLRTEPDFLPVLSRAAWVLATSPDSAVRNAAEAMKLADRAARIAADREPRVLDALAAVYAEAGRYTDAVRTARRALALASNDAALAQAIAARIALYEANKPFRDLK